MPVNAINIAIALTGAVQASLPRSINATINNLQRLQNQARRTATSLGGLSMGGLLGGLTAAGGGYAALSGLRNMMDESVRLAREQQNVTQLLTVELREQARLRHQSLGVADQQLSAIQKQAKALQGQTGLYQNVFLKGAAILAQAGLTTEQIMHMQPYIAQLLVANRMMGKSAESMGEVYQAVSKAVVGMGRNLLSVGVKLDPITRELMVMAAKMHDFAYNINILEQAIAKTYGGAAVKYMQTLQGQADLAAAYIMDWKRRFGDALLPVQMQLTVLQSQLFDIFGPYVLTLLKKFQSGINLISREFIRNREAIVGLVSQGWGKLIMLWQWFKDNKGWLVPFLAFIAKWFIMSRLGMIAWWVALSPIITVFRILAPLVGLVSTALAGPVGLAAATIAAAAAAVMLVNHWDKVKDFFSRDNIGRTLFENIFGTKKTLEAFGGFAPRATPAGAAPGVKRAQPVVKGWLQELAEAVVKFTDETLPPLVLKAFKYINDELVKFVHTIDNWTSQQIDAGWAYIQPILQTYWNMAVAEAIKIWTKLTKWFTKTWDDIIKQLSDAWEGMVKRWDEKVWDPLKNAIKDVGDTFNKYLFGPLKDLNDLWARFLGTIKAGAATDPGFESGGGGGKGRGTSGGYGNQGGNVWLPPNAPGPIRPGAGGISWIPHKNVWSFGIGEDVGVSAANYADWGSGPLKPGSSHLHQLMPWDIAVSRDQLVQYGGPFHMGQWVNVIDRATGKVVWAHQKIADVSSWSAKIAAQRGQRYPTQSIEQRHTTKDIFPQGVGIQAEKPGASAGDVHIHNNVTYHIHGGAHDIESRIADSHRQHIENLKRDLEEVHYRLARNSFVNRAAFT